MLIYILAILYGLPTLIAFALDMPRKWDLLMINFCLGWFIIPWLVCATVVLEYVAE